MITYAIYAAVMIGVIVLISKDNASDRLLKVVLSPDQFKKYRKLHMIPGYSIYRLKKWAKEVKARDEKEKTLKEEGINDR